MIPPYRRECLATALHVRLGSRGYRRRSRPLGLAGSLRAPNARSPAQPHDRPRVLPVCLGPIAGFGRPLRDSSPRRDPDASEVPFIPSPHPPLPSSPPPALAPATTVATATAHRLGLCTPRPTCHARELRFVHSRVVPCYMCCAFVTAVRCLLLSHPSHTTVGLAGHLLEEGVSHLPARPRRSMCHPGRPMGFDLLDLGGSSVVLSPSHLSRLR